MESGDYIFIIICDGCCILDIIMVNINVFLLLVVNYLDGLFCFGDEFIF